MEELRNDDEIEREMIEEEIEWYRNRKWYKWTLPNGDVWIVHDQIFPVPPNVVSETVGENDLVWCIPAMYIMDYRMRDFTEKLCRFGKIPNGYIPIVARFTKEEYNAGKTAGT